MHYNSKFKMPPTIVFQRPRTTIIVLFLVTIIMAGGLGKLTQRNSFDGELPTDDPINKDIEKVEARFDERSVVLFGIETDDIYNTGTLNKIKDLSAEITTLPHALEDEVSSLSTIQNISQREWGLETQGFLDDLPTDAKSLQQLKSDVSNNQNVIGKLVSENGRLAVVAITLEDGFEGGAVYAAAKELASQYQGPEKIHITGAPILVEDVQKGISADSKRFMPIAIVLIFIGFYFCFRRVSGVLLPVLMVVMSIVWTMGLMGYLGLPITVVSNALPVIMVAVASSYGIHFMNAFYSFAGQFDSKEKHIEATLDKIASPILITGITSALGSGSLLIFKITSLREFGLIGAIGFIVATIICLTLLPAICALIPLPKKQAVRKFQITTVLEKVTLWSTANRKLVLTAYLLLLPLFLVLSSFINIGDDYVKFFPKKNQSRQAAEVFNSNLSGIRVMDIMIDATEYGGITDPTFARSLTAFQSYIKKLPFVGSTHSYLDIIDHLSDQISDKNTTTSLSSSEEIAQYLMLYEMSATPGEIYNLRDDESNFAKMQVFLTSSNPEDHKMLYQSIRKQATSNFTSGVASIAFGGDVVSRISLSSYIVKGKIENIILALFIVLITCSLIFKSIKRGLLTLLPIIGSLIMVFGIMGALGIRLGISTSLLTAMIVGIGIDFAVHYLVSYYRVMSDGNQINAFSKTSGDTGKAISFDAASNILGFSILSFSGFLPLQHFGWLLALSMLLIFINTIVLYPAILSHRIKQSTAQYAISSI